MRIIGLTTILSFFIILSYGQTAKSYYKQGLDLQKEGNFKEAIVFFSRTLELDPGYDEAYISRAECYEKAGELKKAATDYDKIALKQGSDEELLYNVARLYFELEEYNISIQRLSKVMTVKSSFVPAYTLMTKAQIKSGNYSEAGKYGKEALFRKNTAENNHLYGLALYNMGDLSNAEIYYQNALKKDESYANAYYDLAVLKIQKKMLDEALELCNKAMSQNPNDLRFYKIRGSVYKEMKNEGKAINDISRAIIMSPDEEDNFFIRGTFYMEFGKYKEALNDFKFVLGKDPDFIKAYLCRAEVYEKLNRTEDALTDYQKIIEISDQNETDSVIIKQAYEKLFVLNKENNKPEIELISPKVREGNAIYLPGDRTEFICKGQVKDENMIKYLKINGRETSLVKENGTLLFSEHILLKGNTSLTIEAKDIYDNTEKIVYKVHMAEANKPVVEILTPYSSGNDVLYLSYNDPKLFIEGKIKDESKIDEITIDGKRAYFNADIKNPGFNATIDISNKDSLCISVKDIIGNETFHKYLLNREEANNSSENPMGKTWVVFIENSTYQHFPSLEGPAKDVNTMRSALSDYNIHNIIHKKDLNKLQMEDFFNRELRDLIRNNQVNSILIWYSGHGKLINETGYWIPVDARRDDEFSFFDMSNLRASMKMYSKNITHLLIVTDACESGSTFYQAMRGMQEKQCDDIRAGREKSSQIFASTGYELAIENSQFTRTFSNALSNNTNACIPIETIVNKVTKAVLENNQRSPVFGNINGLDHEEGTFFFIPK